MKQSAIAAMIERDLLRRDTEKGRVETSHCALCEAGMVYRGRDYCSPRCAQYAADGFPAPDPTYARKAINVPLRSWTVPGRPMSLSVRLTTPTC